MPNTYAFNKEQRFFKLNGKKQFFSSFDTIQVEVDLNRPTFFLVQKDRLTSRINKIEIIAAIAEKLINEAFIYIELIKDLKIDKKTIDFKDNFFKLNGEKQSFLSSNIIDMNATSGKIIFNIFRGMIGNEIDFVSIPLNIAQYLINNAHLKVNFANTAFVYEEIN